MKYILVKESTQEKFVEIVNEKIKEGYVPQGGVSVSTLNDAMPVKKFIYTQALVIDSKKVLKI